MKYVEFDVLKENGFVGVQTTKEALDMKDDNNLENIIKELHLKGTVVKSKQTHSTNIQCVKKDTDLENIKNIDGFISNSDQYILVTYYADCLPIFIFDKETKVYGLLHAGWRGSVNKILEKAIKIFLYKYNSNIENIVVCFGVGISAKNYEIKEDTVEIIKTLLDFDNMLIYEKGKIYLDNTKINEEIALRCGIKKENIYKNDYCTYDDNFYSYRKDKTTLRSAAIFTRKVDNE